MTQKIGDTVFIQEQAPDICEMCDKANELRPYGKYDEAKGRRLNICFDCMKLNEAEAETAFGDLLSGKTQ